MPGIHVRDVTIRLGSTTVLRDLTWTLHAGDVAWVVGENGTGKSSFLRVLACRLKPNDGSVRYHVRSPGKVHIAYYHPGMRLPGEATVGDWAALLSGSLPDATAELETPLVPALPPRRRLRHQSTGEAKRLLLDGILRTESAFTILDEPYEHLSPGARETLSARLRDRARSGVVIVATNQDLPADCTGPVMILDRDQATVRRSA